ncbi:MipA/OmpV family protein [Pseudomonas syringae]|uniref:MipA/OmpV family protein n=1 Tax=Pseudomonas syringae TaxID=317 RepID=UPI001F113500|nr:MipA/OmpV family protein [Pseudomonas syringae]MCH5486003.1 MipA/OmpV family protein [Pseudomonas syringae pv. syringae]MDO1456493.1 MipA/OmpV family protein [Pseudomonas syringae pv. syringae]
MKHLFLPALTVVVLPALSLQLAHAEPGDFSLGLGAAISESPYAGVGTQVNPIPLIRYEGERFYVNGVTAGYHLINTESFALDAILALQMDGIDRDDFGRRELARNGINRDLLEDRDNGIDAGLAAKLRGDAGLLELVAKNDISGASDGYSLNLEYAYPFTLGNTRFKPNIGATHLSGNRVDYYYGTLNEEERRGIAEYRPGSATVSYVGIGFSQPIGKQWEVSGNLRYSALPDELSDSPLLEHDTDSSTSTFIGISRKF